MKKEDIVEFFVTILKQEPDVSSGVAAIRTLLKVLESSNYDTVQELDANLRNAIQTMRSTDFPVTAMASGCELFLRFITLAKLDTKTFEECKSIMVHRGKMFVKKLEESRGKAARHANEFITDKCRILTHSKSRVVLETMELAAKTKHFKVYITESAPDKSGVLMAQKLEELGIECTVILDSAVAYIMEQVDMVMVGAEGVMQSGGIINKIGTYQIALCAREMKKSFYVLTESFKFSRVYPLNQRDIPKEFKYRASKLQGDISQEHPLVDYTPPELITLLCCDLGKLTTAAVCDELIKLYL